ncbi:FAD-binding protein [Sneathiella sp. P13V-1]|uniref:FAD-binding oxidoreductase n=1 Tax=Sneathiella sp. P13V-1 TaxID=2697366 RepID=UPI00187BB19C|nr:FAD-binding protein [Sneathiella sp. P13V-1]MBE7638599.1 FAD-binding protein [Sneathiella sp. P13V-1]
MEKVRVSEDSQIRELLDWAIADKKVINVTGGGTKLELGRPTEVDAELSMSDLNGVLLYEPAELVMKAKAGTRLVEIQKTLKDAGQQMAFCPPDLGPLMGKDAGLTTLGGIFACNLSGSERIKNGAARDHLLGVEGFTGRAEPFHTGSRVMKNVTGYDLCKLIAGSHGTLAVATEFTFKVLPKGEKTRTVVVFGESPEQAVKTMNRAMSSIHEVVATAYLPADIAKRTDIDLISEPEKSVTVMKVEGAAPSAEFRCKALKDMFKDCGDIEELHGMRSEKLWDFTGNVGAFVADQSRIVWKISTPPAEAASYIASLSESLSGLEYYLDWAGGLIWISLPAATENAGEESVRGKLENGHATLIRADASVRSAISPFHPQDKIKMMISEKIRDGFDPSCILNPERMYALPEGAKS